MGLIPGGDYEKGFFCNACFPDGAPRYIKAIVSGVTSCVGIGWSPNGTYLLEKQAVCYWRFQAGNVRVQWFANHWTGFVFDSNFVIENFLFPLQFFYTEVVPCTLLHFNKFVLGDCGIIASAFGGQAELFWGPGIDP